MDLALSFLPSFLEAQSFLQLYFAFKDKKYFGINEEIIYLGSKLGLNPNDVLQIIYTNALQRKEVISALKNGISSIQYILRYILLQKLGFSIIEIQILSKGCIPPQNIFEYNKTQIFKSMGFTSDYLIFVYFLRSHIQPSDVFTFVQNGFSVEEPDRIAKFIKHNITATQALLWQSIGVKHIVMISRFVKANISHEQVFPFLQQNSQLLLPWIETYIKNKLSPQEVGPFNAIGVLRADSILQYIKENISTQTILSHYNVGITYDKTIMQFINFNINANEAASL